MKNFTILLVLWLAGTTLAQAQLFDIQPKLFLENVKTDALYELNDLIISSYSTRDANGDGMADLMMIREIQQGERRCIVIDGKTRTPITSALCNNNEVIEELRFKGWLDISGDEEKEAFFVHKNGNGFAVAQVLGVEQVLFMENFTPDLFRFIFAGDVDNDGRADLVFGNRAERKLIVYGTLGVKKNNAGIEAEAVSAAGRVTVIDSPLKLKYQSPENFRPVFARRMIRRLENLDGDGNGIVDIVYVREGEGGGSDEFVAYDAANQTYSWRFNIDDLRNSFLLGETGDDTIISEFNGFFDIWTEMPFSFFDNNLVVMPETGKAGPAAGTESVQGYSAFRISKTFKMLMASDLDGDGGVEVIGINTADSTVQVWGAEGGFTRISEKDIEKALDFVLQQNFPNPFNPATTIEYQLADNNFVDLEIYNLQGQMVRILVQGQQNNGYHTVQWDGLDDAGQRVAGGTYVYRLKVGDQVAVRRMLLLK
ncbi:T9SS type A sorting domain-containing protein [candidate division KSB1 bacterium]|nr:T9SS type A sorting domain-containing protein [candidate division KSB1 bacterium]